MIHLPAKLFGSACAGAIALAAQAAPAWADTAAAASASTNADASSTQVGEIVVTAEKREEDVQRAPLSVAVVPGATLVDRGVISLFDTGPLVAGMIFSRAPDDGLGLTFRGVGTPARNQSFDQSIALFIDGAFVGKGRLYGASLFDVDRIEFIKSTQSTLLGKNTDVGAISVVNREPGFTYAANASVGARLDHAGVIFDVGVDLPITKDLAVRIAGHINETDGYVHNVYNGQDYPHDQDDAVRATAVYDPSDWIRLKLSYQYTYDHRIGNGFEYEAAPGLLPPSLGEAVLDYNENEFTSLGEDGQSFHKLAAHIVNLTGDFDVGSLKVTSISSYMRYNLNFVDDFDFGPKDGNDLVRGEHYWQASQEVRAASPADQTLSYLIGASAFYSDWISNELQNFNTPLQVGPVPFDTIFLGSFIDEFTQRTTSLSVFGEGVWKITPRLRLNAGIRYTDETKNGSWARPAIAPFTIWNQVLNPSFPKTPLHFASSFPDDNASVEYDVTPRIMTYAAFGQGTKTGGFAEASAVPTGNPQVDALVGDEQSRSVELGAKSTRPGQLRTPEPSRILHQHPELPGHQLQRCRLHRPQHPCPQPRL